MKFWNHNERHADEIDWSTAIAEEKIDGNLMKLFFYKGSWRLASNRTLNPWFQSDDLLLKFYIVHNKYFDFQVQFLGVFFLAFFFL